MAFQKKKQQVEEEGEKRDRDDQVVDSPTVQKKLKGGSPGPDDYGEGAHPVRKMKSSYQAPESFAEASPKSAPISSAFSSWAQREKSTAESQQRRDNMKSRAKLLGFSYIEKNEFLVDRLPNQVDEEDQDECECYFQQRNCSDNQCVNRGALTECFPTKCKILGCKNQRFQKKEWIDFSLVKRGKMGYGVRTEQDVKKGDFIMEYVGDIIDEEEKAIRAEKEGVRHHYTMLLSPGEYIDPSIQGNFGRFLNHSCDPNCETQKWEVLGEPRMGFFAKRDIARGEDLTFDYQFERSGNIAQKCLCGAAKCRGWIGAKKERKKGEDKTKQEDEEEGSSIEEQSYEEAEPEDVLGLGEDGNAVRPWAQLSASLADKVRQMDATLFLVTADLIGPMMQSSKRDLQKQSARKVFLPRCVRRGFVMFYQLMDVSVPAQRVVDALNKRKQYVPHSGLASSASRSVEQKREEVEKLLVSFKSQISPKEELQVEEAKKE